MNLDKKSYEAHNFEYEKYSLEFCLKQQEEWKNSKIEFEPDKPLGSVLEQISNINVGIDIGCGHGYFAGIMANKLKQVIAIEPSKAALEIAKQIYKNKSNISWFQGFAEEVLENINIKEPVLVYTGCVLSHLEDESVLKICDTIDKISKKNSFLCFSEIYGDESHENLWHCRTKYWWQKNLINWDLNFSNFPVQIQGRYKMFYGYKI
jgi:2-polyprenyl-3-methyl-5-hydroxy-6-metoxy-1,4-benzoquinol methylase